MADVPKNRGAAFSTKITPDRQETKPVSAMGGSIRFHLPAQQITRFQEKAGHYKRALDADYPLQGKLN